MSVMSRYSIRLGLQASCPPSRQGKKGQTVIRLQIHVSMYLLCGMNCTTDNCMEDLDVGGMEVTFACFVVQQGSVEWVK